MQSKNFIRIVLISLLSLKFEYAACSSFKNSNKTSTVELQLNINNSSYSIDKNLRNIGYRLGKKDNEPILLYKNRQIPLDEFYSLFVGPDEAKKLFIKLKNTFRKSRIYLNGGSQGTTDKGGTAIIDLYKRKGNYHLQLVNERNKKELNYLFELNDHMKLICEGEIYLNCQKDSYNK